MTKISQKSLKFQLAVWASKEKQKILEVKDSTIVKMKKFELFSRYWTKHIDIFGNC